MSTSTPTNTPNGYQNSNYGRRPEPKKKPTGWIVATFGATALALVGMIAAVFLAFGGAATAGASTHVDHHKTSHAVVVNGGGGNNHHSTGHHSTGHHSGGHPTVKPSAQIETWQRDLGQLNYYEGPVNGYMTPLTVQSITYLQAAAHLPQTGVMNAPTQAAMQYMLVHGNNQMGS